MTDPNLPSAKRRMFLRGSGLALAIPFLPSIASSPFSRVEAQSGGPKRYLQMVSNAAIDTENLTPLPPDHAALVREERLDEVTTWQDLSEIWNLNGGSITPAMSGPAWESLVSKMNIFSGTVLPATSNLHNSTSATTCSGTAHDYGEPYFPYSIDYVAEQYLATSAHAYPALRLNLRTARGYGDPFVYSYRNYCFDGTNAITPMYDIAELEAAIGAVTVDEGAPTDPSVGQRNRLIDRVKSQYDRLVAHPRLSRADRHRLENAITLLDEASVRAMDARSCGGAPTAPTLIEGGQLNFRVMHEYALDLVAYAFACELTPIVSYNLLHYGDFYPQTSAEFELLHAPQHGDYANAEGGARYDEMKFWRLARLAHLGNRLDSIEDAAGGTVLDNTLVYYGQEYGRQGHLHVFEGCHNIMLGGAGGALRTGGVLDCFGTPTQDPDGSVTFHAGAPNNRLATTILHALGLTSEGIEGVTGQVGFGEYRGEDRRQWEFRQRDQPFFVSNYQRDRYFTNEEKRKTFPILEAS